MWEQAKTFTAWAAGSTCATSDLPDVSVKSASQVAAKHVCVHVCVCSHVRESSALKSCWLSVHTCLHLQDRQICLCVFVWLCLSRGVRAVRDRQSSHTGQAWRQPEGCVHWSVTTNSCAGLYCPHPFISPSSTSSPLFRVSEDTDGLSLSAMTVQQQKTFPYLLSLAQQVHLETQFPECRWNVAPVPLTIQACCKHSNFYTLWNLNLITFLVDADLQIKLVFTERACKIFKVCRCNFL